MDLKIDPEFLNEDFLLVELNSIVKSEFVYNNQVGSPDSSGSVAAQEPIQQLKKQKNKSRCLKYLRSYLAKKSSVENPNMDKKLKNDLKELYKMGKRLASNETFSDEEMENLLDKWLDTYAFRFHELHNVQLLEVSETIKLFPGYCYYPLLKADFLRDTKADLNDLERMNWENVIKIGSKSKELSSRKICKKAINFLSTSGATIDAGLIRNVGMIFLVHTTLTNPGINHLVVVVESRDQIGDFFSNNFIMPTIVVVTDSSDFCRAKEILVYVDKIVVGRVSDFYEAVLMCFALHYIFWLNFDNITAPLYRKLADFLNLHD